MAKRFQVLFLILGTSLLFSITTFAYDSVVDRISKSFNVQGRSKLVVQNDDGRTTIQANTANEVRIEVTKEVFHARDEAEAKKEADRVQVTLEQVGDRIEVRTVRPNWTFDFGGRPQVEVNYQIFAPAESDVSTKTSDGPVEVIGIHGNLQISSSDGDITFSDCDGDIDIQSGDGDIHASKSTGGMQISFRDGDLTASELSGKLVLKSSDGDVSVNGFQGKMDASSRDGKVDLNGVFTSLAAKSSDGDVDITIQPGSVMQQDWGLSSRDGDIQVRLPDDFAADLSVRARDGKINTTVPVSVIGSLSENQLSGKLNGGGYLLDIKTSDGDIQILR
ncbi:DUF4097 domain-containing protein [bacterium]|nr:DUF4097 domain-containing protein [bacterium]